MTAHASRGAVVSGLVPTPERPHAAPTHTPGPWRAGSWRRLAGGVMKSEIESVDGYLVAHVIDANGSCQNRANAHLIAAAPDMLARLKTMRGKQAPCEVCQLDDLIAKAEGR